MASCRNRTSNFQQCSLGAAIKGSLQRVLLHFGGKATATAAFPLAASGDVLSSDAGQTNDNFPRLNEKMNYRRPNNDAVLTRKSTPGKKEFCLLDCINSKNTGHKNRRLP